MTRINDTGTEPDGPCLGPWRSLEDYEAAIMAIPALHGWWSAWSADHRADVSGKCSQLTDRSGNGRHLLQGTDANRPLVSADYFGEIGGVARDGLAFSGAADLYLETASNFYDGSSHTWSYAALVVSQGVGQQAITSSPTNNERLFQNSNTNLRFFSPSHSLTIASNTGIISRVIGVRDDPVATNIAFALESNGVGNTSSVARANIAAGKLRLGMGSTAAAQRWNGIIAELIVVKGVLTTDEKALIRAYLTFLYNPAGSRE